MAIQLETTEFKKSLDQVCKGVGAISQLILTEIISFNFIEEEGKNYLVLGSCNGFDSVNVKINLNDQQLPDRKSFCISYEKIKTLVSYLTTEFITLDVKADHLYLKSNGRYKFPFVADSTGEILEVAPFMLELSSYRFEPFSIFELKKLSKFHNSSLDKKGIPFLKNYFLRPNCVVTSNSYKVTYTKIEEGTPFVPISMILRRSFVDFFTMFADDDKVEMGINGQDIIVKSDRIYLKTLMLAGVEDYMQVMGQIDNLAQTQFDIHFQIDKKEIIDLIKRLKIFSLEETTEAKVHIENSKITFSIGEEVEESLDVNLPDVVYERKFNVGSFLEIISAVNSNKPTISFSDNLLKIDFDSEYANTIALLALSGDEQQ